MFGRRLRRHIRRKVLRPGAAPALVPSPLAAKQRRGRPAPRGPSAPGRYVGDGLLHYVGVLGEGPELGALLLAKYVPRRGHTFVRFGTHRLLRCQLTDADRWQPKMSERANLPVETVSHHGVGPVPVPPQAAL